MKILLAGIGSFGRGWYARLKRHDPPLQVAVIDVDPARANELASGDPFYTSLEESIAAERPDALLNATPPDTHTAVNHVALDHRLPILCEKPIAVEFEEAVWIVARAMNADVPFMIAENYRRMPAMRRVRRLLDEGAIGALTALHCDLYQPYRTDKAHFMRLRHPFLVEVVVHHLDLIRYLAGAEARRIYCRSYRPPGSWHPGCLASDLILELETGIQASLSGSLITAGPPTGWPGRWRIEGTAGTIAVADDQVHLVTANGRPLPVYGADDGPVDDPLDDFFRLLSGQDDVESQGPDYLQTQLLVHLAARSSDLGLPLDVVPLTPYATGSWTNWHLYRSNRYQSAIVRDHHLLLIKHRRHDGSSEFWLLPGGGREQRESEEACVRREAAEETCLDVRVERLLLDQPTSPGDDRYYQRFKTYLCTPVAGEARPGYEPEPDAAAAYAIADVTWVDLRNTSAWDPLILQDPITWPLLQRVRVALGYAQEGE